MSKRIRKAGQRKYLTKKERWGEVTVTHTTPTKPDMEVPERIVLKPKKPKRDPRLPIPEVLPGLQNWNQLSPNSRKMWVRNAEHDLNKDQKLHHLK